MSHPGEAGVRKILIVDDQKSNLRLLEQTLRRAGYVEVSSTVDPRDVAAMHRQNHYDLILLDLQMPEMNGFQVLAALQPVRAEHPVSILVLSADATQTRTALEEGADGFMGKPFRLPEVVERVQSILGAAGA
jgi:two-component system cell cycle response regulator